MIKYTIIYNRTGKLKSDGSASVLIKAYLKTRNKYFNTGISVKPLQWDSTRNRVKNNHPNQYRLNRAIKDQLADMEAFEFEVIKRVGGITLDRLADYLKENLSMSFTEFCEKQLNQSNIKKRSLVDQRQSFNKLVEFKKSIRFSELDFKLIKDFDSFLHNQGLKLNTIAKHHKNFKKHINLGIKYGYLDMNKNPYLKFRVRKEVTERTYLTEYELDQVEKLAIPKENEHHKLIKDFFLFCCYTGLRYSDASRITVNNIHEKEDSTELYLISQKTNKPLNLPLNDLFGGKPERLLKSYLNKYRAFYKQDRDKKPMPIFFAKTAQYINRELKKIVENLNIRDAVKRKIHIHAARHTFGSIMVNKVPVPVVQNLMQHSKITQTMVYVHNNPESIKNQLSKVIW